MKPVFDGRPIAQTLTPREDLNKLEVEWNQWMMSVKDTWMEWEQINEHLRIQFGESARYYEAQKELADRAKFKTFVRKLDEYSEKIRELMRLCRLTEAPPDTSASWTWMINDAIAPTHGKPGHSFHIPTKHKHFQEGPGTRPAKRRR